MQQVQERQERVPCLASESWTPTWSRSSSRRNRRNHKLVVRVKVGGPNRRTTVGQTWDKRDSWGLCRGVWGIVQDSGTVWPNVGGVTARVSLRSSKLREAVSKTQDTNTVQGRRSDNSHL